MLISITNNLYRSEQRFLCVSRPRRFGKSMAANMLSSYYSRGCDSSALFSGLKIDNDISFKTHLNQHHVIRLDIQRFLESEQDLDTFIYDIEQAVVEELMLDFPDCKSIQSTSRLKAALDHIFSRTGKGFADVVYLPKRDVNRPALIVELKWDKSAKGAIRQIKEKKYASWIQGYAGDHYYSYMRRSSPGLNAPDFFSYTLKLSAYEKERHAHHRACLSFIFYILKLRT